MRNIVLGLAVLLSACTSVDTSQGGGLYPVAYTAQDRQILAECRYEVKLHRGVAWPDEVSACMRVKGYTAQ